jgi:predicted GIY-YIG superfamily endonuclease
MDASFQSRLDSVIRSFEQLKLSQGITFPLLRQVMPMQGIYLFSENDDHLYVGRSDNIRRRLGLHTRQSSDYFQASFATLLAKERCKLVADYRYRRKDPLHFANQQTFRDAFAASKIRIRAMQVRIVEERDPVNQALLEVYTATVLPTRYNDFSNH